MFARASSYLCVRAVCMCCCLAGGDADGERAARADGHSHASKASSNSAAYAKPDGEGDDSRKAERVNGGDGARDKQGLGDGNGSRGILGGGCVVDAEMKETQRVSKDDMRHDSLQGGWQGHMGQDKRRGEEGEGEGEGEGGEEGVFDLTADSDVEICTIDSDCEDLVEL